MLAIPLGIASLRYNRAVGDALYRRAQGPEGPPRGWTHPNAAGRYSIVTVLGVTAIIVGALAWAELVSHWAS